MGVGTAGFGGGDMIVWFGVFPSPGVTGGHSGLGEGACGEFGVGGAGGGGIQP